MKNKGDGKMTMLQLLDAFRDAKKRKLMVDFAEVRKRQVEKEIDRIESMDDLKIQIFGMDPKEITDFI